MTLGTINHLSLTVSDRSLSEPFYDQILQFMGYHQVERHEEFTMWWQENAGAFLIYAQTSGFSQQNSSSLLTWTSSPCFQCPKSRTS
ncbi:hypothetical protein [Iningainema tapete]|uniref:hypothetical protein n=1 Tax=Iningainema tapete TaxID=2806730 RepID=UPI001EE1D0EA|nr:hypothetical protein [Iningainema tapete]